MRIDKPFFAYRSFNKELATVKRFYDAGVRQFCVFPANTTNSLGQNYSEYPPNWCYFNAYEFEHVDHQIQDILSVAPEAELLFMIDLNSPYWLVRQLADTLCDSMTGLTDALTTQRWRENVLAYMKALLAHVEQAFPGRVGAYILACGQTDEWMDYSQGRELAAKRAAFQEWCRRQGYEIPEDIPTLSRRERADGPLHLRNPERDLLSLRYWRFISECVADSIRFFAVEARKLIPETTKLGCFFGYILELTVGRLVQSGHLAYEKVFSLPELDFFISPGDYSDRRMGGAAGAMSPNGTIHLLDKNYFHEIDHRTSTANMQLTPHVALTWMERWPDEKADIAGIRREFCYSLFHGASLWWFDMWGKFFESPALLDEIANFKKLQDKYGDLHRQPEAEVAVIVDPASTYYVHDTAQGNIASELYRTLVNSLNRLGAPFRVYSFNDIPRMTDWSRLKLVLLPGLFEVTEDKKVLLEKYVLNHNRTIVWTYGAAFSDAIHCTPQAMEPLTGFPPQTEGLAFRDMPGWRSCFAARSVLLPPETLRELAQAAGVHLFTDSPCPVWYDGRLLMVHRAESGRTAIRLKHPAVPKVLLGRKVEQAPADTIVYDFNGPETILLELRD